MGVPQYLQLGAGSCFAPQWGQTAFRSLLTAGSAGACAAVAPGTATAWTVLPQNRHCRVPAASSIRQVGQYTRSVGETGGGGATGRGWDTGFASVGLPQPGQNRIPGASFPPQKAQTGSAAGAGGASRNTGAGGAGGAVNTGGGAIGAFCTGGAGGSVKAGFGCTGGAGGAGGAGC